MRDCVFCRIVARESKADIEYEDDAVLAFKDIYPKAPIHLLIVPKRHIESVATLTPDDRTLVGHFPGGAADRREQGLRRARLSR